MSDGSGQAYRLACLEQRDGNHRATYSAELPGLAAWVRVTPCGPPGAGTCITCRPAGRSNSLSRRLEQGGSLTVPSLDRAPWDDDLRVAGAGVESIGQVSERVGV